MLLEGVDCPWEAERSDSLGNGGPGECLQSVGNVLLLDLGTGYMGVLVYETLSTCVHFCECTLQFSKKGFKKASMNLTIQVENQNIACPP